MASSSQLILVTILGISIAAILIIYTMKGGLKMIVYTTHCPVCVVVENLLKEKKIPFEEVTDVEIMKEKGITSVPVIEESGVSYVGSEAVQYVLGL